MWDELLEEEAELRAMEAGKQQNITRKEDSAMETDEQQETIEEKIITKDNPVPSQTGTPAAQRPVANGVWLSSLFFNSLQHNLQFDTLKIYSCRKRCEKSRNCNNQFLLFSQCFLPYMVLIFKFKCTLKCRLQFVSILTNIKFCCLGKG